MAEASSTSPATSPPTVESTFRELLEELRAFQALVGDVKRSLARLPPPLSSILLVSLRYAEELRHGTDHLVCALKQRDDAAFVADQVRDGRSHLLNLIPDFYMHIDGELLRWCDDALSEAGLRGKGRAEERDTARLIELYGSARLARTADRLRSIGELKAIFDEVIKLAPIVRAAVEQAQRDQQIRNAGLRVDTRTVQRRFWLAFAAFVAGMLLWIL